MLQIREIVEHGDAADVRRMIEADGNVVSVHDHEGSTMLHYAALFDRQSVAELLIARSADVNARDGAGSTPLHTAVAHRQQAMAGMLLSAGADVNAVESIRGWTPLFLAADRHMADLLITNGADIAARDYKCRTPLHKAAENGLAEVVELMLALGADVNDRDDKSWTPLHYAASWSGNRDVVRCLISYGADTNATNRFGMKPDIGFYADVPDRSSASSTGRNCVC